MKPIEMNLKYPGKCCECGAGIQKGARAVWHGRGKVYCLVCINDGGKEQPPEKELTYKQKYGRCEDAPCCGCCGRNVYYDADEINNGDDGRYDDGRFDY